MKELLVVSVLSIGAAVGISGIGFGRQDQELIDTMDRLIEKLDAIGLASVTSASDVRITQGVDYEPLIREQLERNNGLLHNPAKASEGTGEGEQGGTEGD